MKFDELKKDITGKGYGSPSVDFLYRVDTPPDEGQGVAVVPLAIYAVFVWQVGIVWNVAALAAVTLSVASWINTVNDNHKA